MDTDSAEQMPGALGSRLTCPDSCDRVLKNVAYPSPSPGKAAGWGSPARHPHVTLGPLVPGPAELWVLPCQEPFLSTPM